MATTPQVPQTTQSSKRHIDGEQFRLSVRPGFDHPAFDARVDVIRVASEEVWTLDVSDGVAHVQTTTAGSDLSVLPAVPEWVETLLGELGIEEVTVPCPE